MFVCQHHAAAGVGPLAQLQNHCQCWVMRVVCFAAVQLSIVDEVFNQELKDLNWRGYCLPRVVLCAERLVKVGKLEAQTRALVRQAARDVERAYEEVQVCAQGTP